MSSGAEGLNVYLFDGGKGAQAWVGEGQREREWELHSVSAEPDTGIGLTKCNIMTWAKIKNSTLNPLSHPGAPVSLFWQAQIKIKVLDLAILELLSTFLDQFKLSEW